MIIILSTLCDLIMCKLEVIFRIVDSLIFILVTLYNNISQEKNYSIVKGQTSRLFQLEGANEKSEKQDNGLTKLKHLIQLNEAHFPCK